MTELANPLALRTLGKVGHFKVGNYSYVSPIGLRTLGRVIEPPIDLVFKLCIFDTNLKNNPTVAAFLLSFPLVANSISTFPLLECQLLTYPTIESIDKVFPTILRSELKTFPSVICVISKCP